MREFYTRVVRTSQAPRLGRLRTQFVDGDKNNVKTCSTASLEVLRGKIKQSLRFNQIYIRVIRSSGNLCVFFIAEPLSAGFKVQHDTVGFVGVD